MEYSIVKITQELPLYKTDIDIIPSLEMFQCYIFEFHCIMLENTQVYRLNVLCSELA
jgi:hypothetical protein